MKRTLLLIALAATSCVTTGNIHQDLPPNPYKALELTTKGAEFARKGDTFSFEFLDRVNAEAKKDYIISPLSMQFLLGMLLDGAQGETADQIAAVLGYGAGETAQVNEYCLEMLKQLPKLDKRTGLAIANAIFVDDGWPLKDAYKADMGQYYKAEIENLDFTKSAEALKVINGWCSKNTGGMIPKVLDDVSPDILCYLLNAVYFKSEWKEKFKKEQTADTPFTDEAGAKTTVKMMKQYHEFPYAETEVFQAVRLPYGNGAFAMTAFLPTDGHTIADVTATLRKSDWAALRESFDDCDVDLWLPRFESKFNILLNDMLRAMGMPDAFDGAKADFSPMSDFALCLSFVQQHAAIKVDEEGTEAAAVSSAGMEKNSAPMPGRQVTFHADRPFIYLITESSTGAVLFAGRFSNKEKE